MANREKTLRGLESCLGFCHEGFCPKECPYLSDARCFEAIKRDALALLKEQEARVLTKSEATSYPEKQNAFDESDKPPLYVEYKTPQGYFVKWVSVDNVYLWMNDFELNMDYGKEFRFWTSRPTEEQRKAVKWVE